jgi:hypothetical protein
VDADAIWELRAFVYRHFAETARPPSVGKSAAHFGVTDEEIAAAYEELHNRHALFLQPGTHHIQMAFPFSGVETPFRVTAGRKTYFANCAWDSLGIPVALRTDAQIEAACSQSGAPILLQVKDQEVRDTSTRVHFLIPFREWYNDLSFT